MGFEQKFLEKKYFNSVYKITRLDQPTLNFAKRQNSQCELSSNWVNASNEEEVSESF